MADDYLSNKDNFKCMIERDEGVIRMTFYPLMNK